MRVSKGEIRGWIKEDRIDLFPPLFFEDPVTFVQKTGGTVIKESKLRWAAIFTLRDGRRVFIKRDKTGGWISCLKYTLLPSRARKEWSVTEPLYKKHLDVPEPFGWMERIRRGRVEESFYLSEAIGSGASFLETSGDAGEAFPVEKLANTVKRIHHAGVFHKDFHAGNFLYEGGRFFLIDLHRAEILKGLSLGQRLRSLSQLFHSLKSHWSDRDRIRFLEAYFESEPLHLEKREKLLERIDGMVRRLQKQRCQSRTRRCLVESTEFSVWREGEVHCYHRRDFHRNRIERVIGSHLQMIKGNPSSLAKQSPEVVVSLPNDGKQRLCVKHFLYPLLPDRFKEKFRRSKGLKAWVGGNGLGVRGVPSLRPLALVERLDWLGLKESFLLMETSDAAQELDRYLSGGLKNGDEKRLLIRRFARWLSYLHRSNLYHKDMKTCNILISKRGPDWDFYLLDLEDIVLDKTVRGRQLFKNLLQLNTSTPKVITGTERLRFLAEYLRLNPVIKNRKPFLHRLVEQSRRRGLMYVSPQGVVKEAMYLQRHKPEKRL